MFSNKLFSFVCALALLVAGTCSFAQEQAPAAAADSAAAVAQQPAATAAAPAGQDTASPAVKAPAKKKTRRSKKTVKPAPRQTEPNPAQPQEQAAAQAPVAAAVSQAVSPTTPSSSAAAPSGADAAQPVSAATPVTSPAKKKVRRSRKAASKPVAQETSSPAQDASAALPAVSSSSAQAVAPAQPDAASPAVAKSTAPVAAVKPVRRSSRARRSKKPTTGNIPPVGPKIAPLIDSALVKSEEPLPPSIPGALEKAPENIPLDSLKLKFGEAESGMNIYVRFAGTTTAEDLYDVTAPFDGKSKNVKAELFQWVDKGDVLGNLLSEEMTALLNASSGTRSRKEAEKKWSEVYDMSPVKAPESGIIVGLEMKEDGSFYEGDRLFLLARKIFIIAKTTNRLYVPLQLGLEGEVRTQDGIKARAVVRKFLPTGVDGQFLMRLEVVSKNKGLQPGMTFQGDFALLERPGVAAVPTDAVVTKDGRQYVLTLTPVDTGLRDERRSEVIKGLKGGEIIVLPHSINPAEGK